MSEKDCVSRFEHDKVMLHYNWVNRRCMISLIVVCITMVLSILIFATNQTKREEMWQDTIKQIIEAKDAETAPAE